MPMSRLQSSDPAAIDQPSRAINENDPLSSPDPYPPTERDSGDSETKKSLDNVDNKRSGAQGIQDADKRPSLKNGAGNRQPPKQAVLPESTEKKEKSPSIPLSRTLNISKDVSDPILCNLPLDDGSLCTSELPGENRVVFWRHHIKYKHAKLPSGDLTTVDGKGKFTALETVPLETRQEQTSTAEAPKLEAHPIKNSPTGSLTAEIVQKIQPSASAIKTEKQSASTRLALGKSSLNGQRTVSHKSAPQEQNNTNANKSSSSTADDDAIANMRRMMLSFAKPTTSSNQDPKPAAPLEKLHAEDIVADNLRHSPSPPPTKSANAPPIIDRATTEISTPKPIPLPTSQPPPNDPGKVSRSRTTSTTPSPLRSILRNSATPERNVKTESPIAQIPVTVPTPSFAPYLPPLETMSTEQRIEELRNFQTILPMLISQEEEKLEVEKAQREEQMRAERRRMELKEKEEQLAARLKEQQEETARLQKELEEIKRQQSDPTAGIQAFVTPPWDFRRIKISIPREFSDMGNGLEYPLGNLANNGPTARHSMDAQLNTASEFSKNDKMDHIHHSRRAMLQEQREDTPLNYDSDPSHDIRADDLTAPQTPLGNDGKSRPSTARRVTFNEASVSRNIPSPPPSRRFSMQHTDLASPLNRSPLSSIISPPPPIPATSIKRSREATSTVEKQTKRPRSSGSSPTTPGTGHKPGDVHTIPITTRMPATVLLTNSYDQWSNYCLCLGLEGDLNLLDNRTHAEVKPGLIRLWANEYSASAAVNGTWIGPGSLALLHRYPQKNRDATQVSIITYSDLEMSRKPRVTDLRDTPHTGKITAITPMWSRNGIRTFATGDVRGDFFMWELGADNTPKSHPRVVHHLLRTYGILALAYRPSTGALLSAGGLRLFSTDMETGSSAFANTLEPVVSIAPSLHNNSITMLGTKDETTFLKLVDHRIGPSYAIRKGFCRPVPANRNWSDSGAWMPQDEHYFAHGGDGRVYLWDIRRGPDPVSSWDPHLGPKTNVTSTKFVGDQILAMSDQKLSWGNYKDLIY